MVFMVAVRLSLLSAHLQEKFEAAVEEYKTAQEMLASLEGGHNAHRRRCGRVQGTGHV
jgi:hypothetical protein